MEVERDSLTEQSQGLQNQLDKAKAMVRTAREHGAKRRLDGVLCPQSP